MLRSAFRGKTSKESKDEVTSSSALEHSVYKYKDLNHQEFLDSSNDQELDDMDFMDSIDDLSAISNTKQAFGDPNSNLLVKSRIINPSLDHQLDDNDEDNFPYTERQIYEMQLVQLQEQLVATMIQEQEKSEACFSIFYDMDKTSTLQIVYWLFDSSYMG